MLLLKLLRVPGIGGEQQKKKKNSKNNYHVNSSLSYSTILQITLLLFNITIDRVSSHWTQVILTNFHNESQIYPPLNKCCPFHQSYENGQCVPSKDDDTEEKRIIHINGTDRDKYWRPPKSIIYDNTTEVTDNPGVFRFVLAQPNCSEGVIEKIILYESSSPSSPNYRQRRDDAEDEEEGEGDGDFDDFSHLPDVVLSNNGHLIWKDDNKFINSYQYEKFCIDQVNRTAYIVVLCKPPCTEDYPCVRKCCGHNSILVNETCVPAHVPWRPHFYDSALNRVPQETKAHYVVGTPHCSNMYSINMRKEPTEKFYALLNGSLLTSHNEHKVIFSTGEFCIDGTLNDGSWGSGHELDQIAIICYPEEEEEEVKDAWIFKLYAGVMFISTFFLILTASVYLILWEYQTIHGWLQFSYVVSLLFAYSFLAFVQLFATYIHQASPEICEFIGSVIHFSFLSAFFWLSSMNFDLWWTFSGCRPLRATRTGDKKRFAFFGLLSWGGAIVIASTGVALDTIYRGDESSISEYIPQFGINNCYFHNEWSKIPFFYAPVGFLFCVNFIFFLSTIYSLHKLQKDTRFATRQSSKQDKKRFVLFMKLFIVMGVCWIFEVISGLSLVCSPEHKDKLKRAFLFTDILNALQGFFIFLIFTCKPNTCKQLEGQFKKLSVRLEEKRDRTMGSSLSRFFVIGFCAVILPGVHGFRKLFNYCGRPTRTLEGRRNTSHNTVISTFEKSRKDSSACTTLSVIDAGAYEMDTTY